MGEMRCFLLDGEVREFRCANSSIEKQIEESYYQTLLKQAYGYKITVDGKVVGYYMLYFKSISIDQVNNVMGDEYLSNLANYYTGVQIGYFAIDRRVQHQGLGTRALKLILADILRLSHYYPIRFIMLDALKEYHEWYYNIGFRDFPGYGDSEVTRMMYVNCMTKEDAERFSDYVECI